MFFAMKPACAALQHAVGFILASAKWQRATAFINDIIPFSKTKKIRLKHIDEALRLSKDAEMTIKLESVSFLVTL